MSMSAGLALMSKLGAKVSSVSSPGLSLGGVRAALRDGATNGSIYALKVDDGDKKGWYVKEAVQGGNPIIVDPNDPNAEAPKQFDSEQAANTYKEENNLQYVYPDSSISTISSDTLVSYDPESSNSVDDMTGLLGPDCLSKNAQCWSQDPPRPGTPAEFMQVIKQKILSYG